MLKLKTQSMYIVHVYVHVKKGLVEDFKILTKENAKDSLLEPGIVRFDIVTAAG